ncbi:MAG: TonB C-terminal domain-containing protein [Methylophilales bacterium]|nr:TonB C-terminal domain-containing protein [Methylophilales bacterium]
MGMIRNITPPPEVKPEPPPPPPEIKPEVKPEIKPEPKPEPPPEPKAEIQVKPKPPEVKKPDPELKKKEEEKKRKAELEKLKKAMLEDAPPEHEPLPQETKTEPNPAEAKRAADLLAAAGQPSANADEINKYKARIIAAIQRKVNKQLCGTGKPELVFAISLMPTGQLNGEPRLKASSGMPACDQAVETAIRAAAAQSLPMPPQELFSQFRDLNLKFKPNE